MKSKNEINRLLEANKAFMNLTVKIVNGEYEHHELLIWDKVAKDTSNYIQKMRKDLKPVVDELTNSPN